MHQPVLAGGLEGVCEQRDIVAPRARLDSGRHGQREDRRRAWSNEPAVTAASAAPATIAPAGANVNPGCG
jgi:hypothetical protein